MNRKNRESLILRARDTVRGLANKAAMVGTGLMVSGAAMAQDPTFDPSTIVTKVTTYAGYALVILLAFAAAVWGLKAAGLIGGRR